MSWSTDFADLQDNIVSACSKHERENGSKPDYSRAFPFQGYFVKFGPHSTFNPEVMTLKYLADLAAKDSSAPRVPRVLHYFYQQGGMAYVLMDLIQLVQVSPDILTEKAVQAVRWMRDVRVPDDVVLGPKGGGLARHKVFKDSEAPRSYRSVMALERYFNKVHLRRSSSAHADLFFPKGCEDSPAAAVQKHPRCQHCRRTASPHPIRHGPQKLWRRYRWTTGYPRPRRDWMAVQVSRTLYAS